MSRRRAELVPDQPNVVVLESYVSSSEGQTIHIDVQSLARLNELEALIQNLASGKLQRVLLSRIAGGALGSSAGRSGSDCIGERL
jgi:hypothetical protein